MIQRVQTLFLLQLVFLSVSLLFVPVQFIDGLDAKLDLAVPISLLPSGPTLASSTGGHYTAIALNLLGIALALITIFIFKKRELQVKLGYVLMLVYVALAAMIAFCPFVSAENSPTVRTNIFSYIICAVCILSAWLAIRFIKKDINLLKSADRIR